MSETTQPQQNTPAQLEGGTYEVIKKRLQSQGQELRNRLAQLNQLRREVFGNVEAKLLTTERISTANNCVPRDMVPVGKRFIFGYNVQIKLKSEVAISDVFSVYEFTAEDHSFREAPLDLLADERFDHDFKQLYKYYKDTVFSKFAYIGPFLHLVFQIGKTAKDVKTFKWAIEGEKLIYIDNRSEHEFKFPAQHEFEWVRTHRDLHRGGQHPHVSVLDRVFVETIGGDLTVKIEDNTDTGQGIYAEEVEQKNQKLDDAEILYANLGNIILLKIRPYQEKKYRYLAFNDKLKEVRRIDSIEDSCVMLPDDHGIIFSNGYYLASGELKIFESALTDMRFERKLQAPNGEDFLYIFYNQESGDYVLLSYNLIAQRVETPIVCNGYSIFRNGELVYFKADSEPKKTHAIQVWKTPYVHPDLQVSAVSDSYLFKVGNKDIVRGMAAATEIASLTLRDEVYASLYMELVKKCSDALDRYYWIAKPEAANLGEVIAQVKEASTGAIDEFEKVVRVQKATQEQIAKVSAEANALMKEVDRKVFKHIDEFVKMLASLRKVRGEAISLKELRYTNMPLVDDLEKRLGAQNDKLSNKCVEFLLREDALLSYTSQVAEQEAALAKVSKVADADALADAVEGIAASLDLLIDIVSNLKIQDATQTTQIIDRISSIYSNLNNTRAKLKAKRKELLGTEAVAEFNAQLKLLNQSVINYLDVSETPQKCEEYLTKVMVMLEELEGKFAAFDEFAVQLAEKRDEIYNAFESKKLALLEARNKRASSLQSAADRILKGIRTRVASFKEIAEINGYFAADLMVDKVRDIVKQLQGMDDSVKADELQSQLKSLKEEAVRQLKDRQELFVGGENVIQFGKHRFSVNVQELDLSMVYRNGDMYYHLSGTNFFEKVEDAAFNATRPYWDQSLLSENKSIYRAEYLAYLLFKSGEIDGDVLEAVRKFASPRYQEGYVKGVHDNDAALILKALLDLDRQIGLLRFTSETRACANLFWHKFTDEQARKMLEHRIQGLSIILQVFPDTQEFGDIVADLQRQIDAFVAKEGLFLPEHAQDAGLYLFQQLTASNPSFVISPEAGALHQGFLQYLEAKKVRKGFDESVKRLQDAPEEQMELLRNWVKAYMGATKADRKEAPADWHEYVSETAVLLLLGSYDVRNVLQVSVKQRIAGMAGDHPKIQQGEYMLDYNHFMQQLRHFEQVEVPAYVAYSEMKKAMVDRFRQELRLNEFKPRVLSSFVRNRLIDEVYLPLIGDNLAKQMGVVGENKRTDLMGMLLLISPPGYGKTTLMEYVASRLGIIFMKINGPAIGHRVTSLDPAEAPNASAREEVEKLNLAFEMGDNVMVYLDDIQHCNPEFLQKFISLCDGQRKIEGIYKGVSKTYDLRGKKVCVVMAGNPYTESGEKFQIPDMLANRADTYNLGDIIGDSREAFELSYIENSLTSNAVLNKLAGRSKKDIHTLIRYAKTGSREGISFETNISADELNEYVSVLQKMLRVQDVILKVNMQYIASAAQADEYRTEPPFKLQGSYRNMNKLTEKIVPIMNEQELRTLIVSHYEGEAQTLTSGAEANLLKFRELNGLMSEKDQARWKEIKDTFQKNQKLRGIGGNADQMAQVLLQMSAFTDSLDGIKQTLEKGLGK